MYKRQSQNILIHSCPQALWNIVINKIQESNYGISIFYLHNDEAKRI